LYFHTLLFLKPQRKNVSFTYLRRGKRQSSKFVRSTMEKSGIPLGMGGVYLKIFKYRPTHPIFYFLIDLYYNLKN
jgi:hypothetical protein